MSRLLHHPETASDIWAEDKLGIQGIGDQHQIVVSPWPVLLVNKTQPTSVQGHHPEYAVPFPVAEFQLHHSLWTFGVDPSWTAPPDQSVVHVSAQVGQRPE